MNNNHILYITMTYYLPDYFIQYICLIIGGEKEREKGLLIRCQGKMKKM